MISLKRNTKGKLVQASGLRSRTSSFYAPNQKQLFRISRSKFADFLNCRRCFYLDRVRGLIAPSTPGWTLNETTDLLLKREFDLSREAQVSHRTFERFGLATVVPFQHEDLDLWRDSLHHGLEHQVDGTNIILHGGIDDLWYDHTSRKIIVVEYKSQANSRPVRPADYLANVYHESYKIQIDIYAYLLTHMGFDLSPVGYFYVCNADRSALTFNGTLIFEETLVPYYWDTCWIDRKLLDMIDVLNSERVPNENPSCENCAYARQRSIIESPAR